MNTAIIDLVISGDIARDNEISLRNLSKIATALQASINRSYLDVKRDGVIKHARLAKNDYPLTDFQVGAPREGSFRIDFTAASDWSLKIVDRLNQALTPLYERIQTRAVFQSTNLYDRALILQEQINKGIDIPVNFKEIDDTTKREYLLRYGDRSILKEFDRLVHIVRPQHAGESNVSVSITGTNTSTYPFNRAQSQYFRQAITHRELGRVIRFKGRITMLDTDNLNAHFDNYETGKKCTLLFKDLSDILLLSDKILKEITILASPVMEYSGFDYVAGDIFFIMVE